MKRGPEKQFNPEVALRAAIEVFRVRGYEGASLVQLTEAMGIGKKSMYDTFGNKRALFLKALQQYGDDANDGIEEILFAKGPALKNLKKLLSKWQKASAEKCNRGCMIGTNIGDFEEADSDVVEILNGHLRRTEKLFRRSLEQALEEGELDGRVTPAAGAKMLVCVVQGANLIGRVSKGNEPSHSAFRQVMACLEVT